ncbi:MAG: hypothetical protein WCI20_00710 [bacterium]
MADKSIPCQNCGNVITVSEFVSAKTLTCMKCKAQVTIPIPEAAPVEPQPKLRLAPSPVTDSPTGSDAASGDHPRQKKHDPHAMRNVLPQYKRRKLKRRVTAFEVKVLPWLLFFILAAILAWVRYVPGAVSPDLLKLMISGGVWTLLFLHISVVCYAFTDDSFFGILCLIIPGYSLYYLYVQSDQMILRSLAGALLIAFGWDALLAAQNLWIEVYNTVSIWIATTDTIKKK